MAGREETVSDEVILGFFEESPDPVLSTAEVADRLDFSYEGARKRLYQLVEDGHLDYKKAGNSPVFWLTETGEEMNAETE